MSAFKGPIVIGASVVAVVISIAMVLGGFFTVEQGERTVVLRAGAVSYVAEPGFHLKLPLIDSTHDMEVRTQKMRLPKIQSYSRDIQQSESIIAINYRLPESEVRRVYERFGRDYESRIILPAVLDKFKEVFGQYTAAELIFERAKIGNEVFRAIAEEVKPSGLIIEAIQIENIDFTDEFEKAIEAAVKAKAEVTQAEQILLRKRIEAQSIVVQATAQADAARQQAQGAADAQVMQAKSQAEATRLQGDAQAAAALAIGLANTKAYEAQGAVEAQVMELKGKQLAASPRMLELEAMRRWDGKLPHTFVPGSALPFLPLANAPK